MLLVDDCAQSTDTSDFLLDDAEVPTVPCEVAGGIEKHLPQLWRFALRRSADPSMADDLVQATCVRALERAEQFVRGTRLESWLFAILESIWRNMQSAQCVRTGNGVIDIADAHIENGDADEGLRAELSDAMREIEGLPAAQRSALLLTSVEGFSYREAADALNLPIGTVMSRVSTARAKLKASLAGSPNAVRDCTLHPSVVKWPPIRREAKARGSYRCQRHSTL